MNVDYDELEMAMATDPSWDPRFFLNTETGQVASADDWYMTKAQGYERFEDLPQNDDDLRLAWTELWQEGQVGGEPTDVEREAIGKFLNRFVRVPQFETHEEYNDMERFAYQVEHPVAAEQLQEALGGRGSFRRFKDVLYHFPALRDQWHDFQSQRRRRRIDEWLWSKGLLEEEQIGQGSALAEDVGESRLQVLNFAHPLTAEQEEQLRVLLNQDLDVRQVHVQFDNEEPFADQVAELVDELETAPATWQTEQFLVIPPGYAPIASALMAELHGRMGYFPSMVRLKSVQAGEPTHFAVAEVVDLQAVHNAARHRRHD